MSTESLCVLLLTLLVQWIMSPTLKENVPYGLLPKLIEVVPLALITGIFHSPWSGLTLSGRGD